LAPPSAGTITVAQTLALLDGPFVELAEGVAEGQYALWLGSGISRDVVGDLKDVVTKVLRYLREHADFATPGCAFVEALGRALGLAQLSALEKAHFDPQAKFEDWSDELLEILQHRLVGKYSRLLDVRVKGKDPNFLLWEVVDVPAVYANPTLTPRCEHLCVGILAIEGVVSQAPTANWDGLIEKGVDELAGPGAPVLRVCVVAEDFVEPARRMRLLKFHGCAVRARDNPDKYGNLLVGRQGHIEDWAKEEAFKVMRQQMVSLATVQHTLMIGLSAQDTNIRDVFRDGKAAMAWPWPSHPPAYVFAEDAVGDDQRVILSSVYRDAYDADPDGVTAASQIRAFAKPLLVALILSVLYRKLSSLADCAPAPNLTPADRAALADGLRTLRDRVAAGADGDRTAFVRALVAVATRGLRTLRGAAGGPGAYEPLGTHIVSQIPADPNNLTSGLPELAAALGLLGLGESDAQWTVDRTDPSALANGSLKVTKASEAALQLFTSGAVGDNEPDAC
jgi:hypothetical protein